MLERSRIRRLLRLEILLGIEPCKEFFLKFRISRLESWERQSGNSLVILLSWISRYSSLLNIINFLDKLPENLFLPNTRILVTGDKFVGISTENSFEDKSMISSSTLDLKSGNVWPDNLLFDKSNNTRLELLEMDSGTFPEKSFLPNIGKPS